MLMYHNKDASVMQYAAGGSISIWLIDVPEPSTGISCPCDTLATSQINKVQQTLLSLQDKVGTVGSQT